MEDLKIKFYSAHNLNLLMYQLAENLSQQSFSLSSPYKIITQTKGINAWIEQNITAQKDDEQQAFLEIFMNYKFQTPMQLIMDIYYDLGGTFYSDASNDMLWSLYDELGKDSFQRKYSSIAAYYGGDDRKRYELAVKVTDLFDQYEVYRTDMLLLWNEQKLTPNPPYHEEWQQYLWTTIRNKDNNKNIIDKLAIKSFIIHEIHNNPSVWETLKPKYDNIHSFGLVSFSSFHTHIFHELARGLHINFYLINHAPNIYWIEDKSRKDIARLTLRKRNYELPLIGNELLTNWGKLFQETNFLLYRNGDLINYEYNLTERHVVTFPHTLLGHIQSSIYHNEVINEDFTKWDEELLNDRTLVLANTHTIIRELQALYNYLIDTLAIYNQDEVTITDRDILIIVNDINAYTPYIKAVFDNAPRKFYYQIADQSMAKGNNLIAALIGLMDISEANFTANSILSLLEFEAISKRFQLEDVALVKKLLADVNARFGMKNSKDDDTYLVSIQHAMKRLMYGLCFDGERVIRGDILTNNTVASNQEFLAVLHLYTFVEQLQLYFQNRNAARSINQWHEFLQETIEHFIYLDYYDDEQESQLESVTKLLTLKDDDLYRTVIISYDVYKRHLQTEISYIHDEERYYSGGITFCSPIPYRSVPFKVVAMLGMNVHDFPRKNVMLDFDLQKNKHIGDRNIKYNDKQLMLETIMSATTCLYLSYIGQDVKTNKEKPPSLLVDELLNYLQEAINTKEDIRKKLVVTHPLHNYSTKYNKGNGLNNYLIMPQAAQERNQNDIVTKGHYIFPDTLSLSQIHSFLKNPSKYYFTHILNIYLDEGDEVLPEVENFDMNGLEIWSYKDSGFTKSLMGEGFDEYWQKEYLKGGMPLKNTNIKLKNEVQSAVQSILQGMQHTGINVSSFKSEPIHISLDDVTIVGTIKNLTTDKAIIFPSFSKVTSNEEKQINLYLQALAGMHQGIVDKAYFIYLEEEMPVVKCLPKIEDPMGMLRKIIQYMKLFCESPYFFWAGMEGEKIKNNDNFYELAYNRFINYSYTDPYFSQLILSDNVAFDAEKATAIYHDIFQVISNAFISIES